MGSLSFDEIEKPDLSFLSGEEESATEESFTTPVKEERGSFQQPSFTGVGGPQGSFRGFEPVPFKAEVKTEYPSPAAVGGSTPWGNTSCQAVKTEVKPEPDVKDEV